MILGILAIIATVFAISGLVLFGFCIGRYTNLPAPWEEGE